MAGTLRGKIDCFLNTGSIFTNAQQIFKNIYDFCKSHPNMSEIARNGGIGGTAASVDYSDGANPFLTNAWFVFRMNNATLEDGSPNPHPYAGSRTYPWYFYCQWSRGDTVEWNTGVSAPSLCNGSDQNTSQQGRVGCQFAIPVGTVPGTSQVAWNGSGTMGTNTKGSPVWLTTAGTPTGFQGSYVFPRSNNTGGSHSTIRENCVPIFNISATTLLPVRQHILADDDSLLTLCSPSDNHSQWQFNYFGLYTPRPGLVMDYPMIHVNDTDLPWASSLMGDTAGTATAQQGGIPVNGVANGVRGVILTRHDEWLVQTSSPNRMFQNETYDLWEIPIIVAESPWVGYAGTLGQSPMSIFETFGFGAEDTNTAKTRIGVGSTASQLELKVIVPWDGSTFHRNTFVREGVSFP